MLMAFFSKRAYQKAWYGFFLLGISLLLALLVLPFFCNQKACAANVTLEWDPNPEPDIAGYEIYYGFSSRNYSKMIDVRSYTSCTIGDLELGVTYYLAAKAYNTSGYRSDYSDEVRFTLGEPAEEPPPANNVDPLPGNDDDPPPVNNDDDPQPGQSYGGSSRGPFDVFGGCFIETSMEESLTHTKAVLAKCSSMLTHILSGLALELNCKHITTPLLAAGLASE
jgi:hypothetical protein